MLTRRCNASAVGVESDCVHETGMVIIAAHDLLAGEIPHLKKEEQVRLSCWTGVHSKPFHGTASSHLDGLVIPP